MSRNIKIIVMKEAIKKIQEFEAQKIERIDLVGCQGSGTATDDCTCCPSGNRPHDPDWLFYAE
jgi:hypothetical protein